MSRINRARIGLRGCRQPKERSTYHRPDGPRTPDTLPVLSTSGRNVRLCDSQPRHEKQPPTPRPTELISMRQRFRRNADCSFCAAIRFNIKLLRGERSPRFVSSWTSLTAPAPKLERRSENGSGGANGRGGAAAIAGCGLQMVVDLAGRFGATRLAGFGGNEAPLGAFDAAAGAGAMAEAPPAVADVESDPGTGGRRLLGSHEADFLPAFGFVAGVGVCEARPLLPSELLVLTKATSANVVARTPAEPAPGCLLGDGDRLSDFCPVRFADRSTTGLR